MAGAGVRAGGGAGLVLTTGAVAWPVSGRTAAGLRAQAGRLARSVAARPGLDPADVGFSLATTRSVFEHRAVVLGGDRAGLAAGLAAVAAGEPAAGVVSGVPAAGGRARVGFVFAGQGSQRAGMGAGLHAASPAFAAAFDRACGLLEAGLGVPVAEVVLGRGGDGDGRADQTLFAQAGLFAVQAGLVALLAAAGITPDAVAGHSAGEVAAAHAAGVLSLEDACALVAARARLMQALPGGGAMTAIAAPEAEVRAALDGVGGVSLAAVNGPASVVVSGEAAAVEAVAGGFRARGVRVRALRVSRAFHSHRMDPVLAGLGQAAAGITLAAPRIAWAGALTGELVTSCEPGYWARQAREPVRFADAVTALAGQEVSVFLEIGPDGTLSALGAEVAAAPFIPLLRPGQPAPETVLAGLARAHVHGAGVDWAAVLPGGQRVELPTYAFERQRYWPRPGPARAGDLTAAGLAPVGHPLLGAAVELAGGAGLVLTGLVSARAQPWLADHVVAGTALLPGTAFVEMAIQAGDAAGCGRVEELTLEAPLALPAGGAARIQVLAGPDENGQRTVQVYARPAEAGPQQPWTRHASGLLGPATPHNAEAAQEFAQWPPQDAEPVEVEGLYDTLAAGGYGYGPSFRGLRAAWRRGGRGFRRGGAASRRRSGRGPVRVASSPAGRGHARGRAGRGYGVRPGPEEIRLPFAWNGCRCTPQAPRYCVPGYRRIPGGGLSLAAADGAGMPVISVGSLLLRPVAAAQLEAAGDGLRDALFGVGWLPAARADVVVGRRWGVIGEDGPGLSAGLAAAGADAQVYLDLAALAEAVEAGEPVPQLVLACAGSAAGSAAEAARAESGRVLELVQRWLGSDPLAGVRLVVVTRGAVAVVPGEGVADLAGAAVWGLVRSAQSENPGRLVLADLPMSVPEAGIGVLAAALDGGEPEVAVRDGVAYGRRLVRPSGGLVPPDGGVPWRLAAAEEGTLDGLRLAPFPQASRAAGAWAGAGGGPGGRPELPRRADRAGHVSRRGGDGRRARRGGGRDRRRGDRAVGRGPRAGAGRRRVRPAGGDRRQAAGTGSRTAGRSRGPPRCRSRLPPPGTGWWT